MPRYKVTFVTTLVDEKTATSENLRDTMEIEAIGERVAALKVANTVHGTPQKLQFYPQFRALSVEQVDEPETA